MRQTAPLIIIKSTAPFSLHSSPYILTVQGEAANAKGTRSFWEQIASEFNSKGSIIKTELCAEQGVKRATLDYWLLKFRDEQNISSSAGFVRVAATPPDVSQRHQHLQLRIRFSDNVVIELPLAVDRHTLTEKLRSGTVPEHGLDKFAVGIDKPLNEIRRQLELAAGNEGAFKFLRGGYGCGKTFMSQYTVQETLKKNFAVSFIVVSPNDTQFHKFDDVYHKIVSGLPPPWRSVAPWKMPLIAGLLELRMP